MPRNDAPLLMIAAGTGIAPFRGFIRTRIALRLAGKTLGPATLLFGCQNEHGELCHEVVEKALAVGAISRYEVAYSRSTKSPKQYVQHKLRETPDIFTDLIGTHSGHVFICGDASIAVGVQDTVCDVLNDTNIVHRLKSQERWHEDIFGSPLTALKSIESEQRSKEDK